MSSPCITTGQLGKMCLCCLDYTKISTALAFGLSVAVASGGSVFPLSRHLNESEKRIIRSMYATISNDSQAVKIIIANI